MCLVSLAWKCHPRWPLLLAGNRDEFHARPSLAAARWADAPSVFGGRDTRAGGSWLAVGDDGRVAVITNHREPEAMAAGARSRGDLVADFVRDGRLPEDDEVDQFGPFHLLTLDGDRLAYTSNRARPRDLEDGIHTLSNAALGTGWPKVRRLEAAMRSAVAQLDDAWSAFDHEPLLAALSDETRADDAELPDTGVGVDLEGFLSSTFINGDRYGTRCSTVVAFHADGSRLLLERSFGPDGAHLGDVRLEF